MFKIYKWLCIGFLVDDSLNGIQNVLQNSALIIIYNGGKNLEARLNPLTLGPAATSPL